MIDAIAVLVVGAAVLAVVAGFAHRPRAVSAMAVSLMLAFSEDLFRKVLGVPTGVTLLKDAAVIPLALAIAGQKFARAASSLDIVILTAATGLVFLGAAHVVLGLTTLPLALIGLRSYVFYLPWMYLGARAARDRVAVERILVIGVILTAAVGLLTLATHHGLFPHGAAFSAISDDVAKRTFTGAGGDVTLESGIFALGERLARYSLFALILCIALRGRGAFARRWLWVLSLIGSTAGLYVAQRRAPWVLLVLALLVMSSLSRRGLSVRVRRLTVVATALLVVAIFVGGAGRFEFAFSTVEEFGSRGGTLTDVPNEVSVLTGVGLGRFSQGGHQLGVSTDGPGVEGGIPKVVSEGGVAGATLYLLLLVSVVGATIRRARTSRDEVTAAIAAISVVTFIWFLKGHMILGDSQTLMTLFLLIGVARTFGGPQQRPSGTTVPSLADRALG
jgi:hypothetical protein